MSETPKPHAGLSSSPATRHALAETPVTELQQIAVDLAAVLPPESREWVRCSPAEARALAKVLQSVYEPRP